MKLLSLNLQNFRGIKSLNINFEGKSANIYGAKQQLQTLLVIC